MTFQNKCGKVCYPTRQSAKNAKKKYNTEHLIRNVITGVYYCDTCDSYHITSQPKKKRIIKHLKP